MPRKGGPGITQADVLVANKVDRAGRRRDPGQAATRSRCAAPADRLRLREARLRPMIIGYIFVGRSGARRRRRRQVRAFTRARITPVQHDNPQHLFGACEHAPGGTPCGRKLEATKRTLPRWEYSRGRCFHYAAGMPRRRRATAP